MSLEHTPPPVGGDRERAAWFAVHILPLEPSLRAWLGRHRVAGLDVDDIVQETYAILAALKVVSHIAAPRAYAFQTARSVISRHVRRGRALQIEATGDLAELSGGHHDELSPERRAAAREELKAVAAVIAKLPRQCRRAFLLKRVEGLSQRDIAQRMGISESAVEKHIWRALRALTPR